MTRSWTLMGPDGQPVANDRPGTVAATGVRGSADAWTARPPCARSRTAGNVTDRVFFADRTVAQAAGYRPCAVCLPVEYAGWKAGDPSPPAPGGTLTA